MTDQDQASRADEDCDDWAEDALSESKDGEERNNLAEARTAMAEDRTVLANERTYAGWMRTAFAAVGIGLAFNALFVRMEPWWAPRAIATAFFIVGIYIMVSAEQRACAVQARLHAHKVEVVRTSRLRAITVVASIAVAALVAALWMLPSSPG